jgi:catechol 2,3-dioxygenase-like lactoylglutathione lyase family enzyme
MGILANASPVAFVLVRDRPAAKAFYSDVLDLALVAEDDFASVYDLNGTVMRLTTVESHQPSPHTDEGIAFAIQPKRPVVHVGRSNAQDFVIHDHQRA